MKTRKKKNNFKKEEEKVDDVNSLGRESGRVPEKNNKYIPSVSRVPLSLRVGPFSSSSSSCDTQRKKKKKKKKSPVFFALLHHPKLCRD
jgi:hypothetical protein